MREIPSVDEMIHKISSESADKTKEKIVDILNKFRSAAVKGQNVILSFTRAIKEYFELQILLNLIWVTVLTGLYIKGRIRV
jgi:hypothetical protein